MDSVCDGYRPDRGETEDYLEDILPAALKGGLPAVVFGAHRVGLNNQVTN